MLTSFVSIVRVLAVVVWFLPCWRLAKDTFVYAVYRSSLYNYHVTAVIWLFLRGRGAKLKLYGQVRDEHAQNKIYKLSALGTVWGHAWRVRYAWQNGSHVAKRDEFKTNVTALDHQTWLQIQWQLTIYGYVSRSQAELQYISTIFFIKCGLNEEVVISTRPSKHGKIRCKERAWKIHRHSKSISLSVSYVYSIPCWSLKTLKRIMARFSNYPDRLLYKFASF